MEIRLSKPDQQFDLHIQDTAAWYGCFAHIKKSSPQQCRFTLLQKPGSAAQADYETQDSVIYALLKLDPEAEIRTAKAIYIGLSDFERQRGINRS